MLIPVDRALLHRIVAHLMAGNHLHLQAERRIWNPPEEIAPQVNVRGS